MNKLYALLGAPGGGKSSWIIENNLQEHTISPDDLRLLFSPNISAGISQKYNKEVWELLYRLIECRAKDQVSPIIIDATNSKMRYFNSYKKIVEKYNYKVVGVKFHHPMLSIHLTYNLLRPAYKHVPWEIVGKMWNQAENFLTHNKEFTVITPKEALKDIQMIHSSMVEHRPFKWKALGSSPSGSAISI